LPLRRPLPANLWPLGLSVCIHLAVVLPWVSQRDNHQSPLPAGHWVEMVPGMHADPKPRAATQPKTTPPSPTSLETKAQRPKPAGDASPRPLGNTDRATGLTGQVGDTQ